jgi:iron(III) transport system ATP-binding protein
VRRAEALRFESVSKRYGAVTAVHEVSFSVAAGELVTLLGPSGCGKTTTLRMIAGLEFPTSGRIFIGERDVTRLPATARDVAMVFQSYALFPHMSVAENVGYGLVVSGRPKAEVRERVEAALAMVGLQGLGGRYPAELSGGQQQRVAVARAVILEPRVLLFDEPLSNLDARLRRRVREEIRELQQKLAITSVYVTHDQAEALAVSDRIIVMDQARIAQEGTPRELYETPASRFVADFIGEANLLPVEIERVRDGRAAVRLGPVRLDLPARQLSTGPALLAVRPHAVRLAREPDPGRLPVRVAKATYLGAQIEYELESEAGSILVVDQEVAAPLPPGTAAFAEFGRHGVCLVPG